MLLYPISEVSVNLFGRLSGYYFGFGPGWRSRAKYSLIANFVVNQLRPSFLAHSSPLSARYRRCLVVNPLILAASLSEINSSRPGWSSLDFCMFVIHNNFTLSVRTGHWGYWCAMLCLLPKRDLWMMWQIKIVKRSEQAQRRISSMSSKRKQESPT